MESNCSDGECLLFCQYLSLPTYLIVQFCCVGVLRETARLKPTRTWDFLHWIVYNTCVIIIMLHALAWQAFPDYLSVVKLGAHWLPWTTEYIIYYHCLVYGTGAQRINTETIAFSKTIYNLYTQHKHTHTIDTHTLHICVENLLLWWES